MNSRVSFPDRVITLDASGSMDPDGENSSLTVRWDFDSKNGWDTEFSTDKLVNWTFPGNGVHIITLEVKDKDGLADQVLDSIQIFGPFQDSIITDPRDYQTYRVVKIKNIWVMAENLRYGNWIKTSLPQTDNGIPEFYLYNDDSSDLHTYGGLYSQYEALNYQMNTKNQGICMPGWRVPDVSDWNQIDIKVSQYFIKEYYGPGGISSLNLEFGGHYLSEPIKPPLFNGSRFQNKFHTGEYWTTSFEIDDIDGMRFQGAVVFESTVQNATVNWMGFTFTNVTDLYEDGGIGPLIKRNWFFSIRCVKDS